MDSITMASQRDWILMQFAAHQNSSVEPSTKEQLIVYLSRFHDGYGQAKPSLCEINSGYNGDRGGLDTLIFYFDYQEYLLLPHARAAAT
jgi:hypothetical protein